MRERLDTLMHWIDDAIHLLPWLEVTGLDLHLDLNEAEVTADLSYGRDEVDARDSPRHTVGPTLH